MTASSTDLIYMLFPNIVTQLNQMFTKFAHDFEISIDKKGKLPNYSTPAVHALLADFPHSYQSYMACVDLFVEVAKSSPDSAIAVLLKILPDRPNNSLYSAVTSGITQFSYYSSLYNLIIILFFADCVAQILTVNVTTQFSEELFELGYNLILPYSEEYETNLRLTIVKQYSVIFSLLSINHLSKILDSFSLVAKKSDLSLFFVLHRFLRLSFKDSESFDKVHKFLKQFARMDPLLKDKKQKSSAASDNWAMSITHLISQLNTKECPDFIGLFETIYKNAILKATGKNTHLYHVVLCANIIVRVEKMEGKTYDDFLKDVIFKSKDTRFLEQSLSGFLTLMRGRYVSKSTFFWEWGNYNAHGNIGIETTHLLNPEEDQASPNSFTNLFFNHFVHLPIEQYPHIVGDIFMNLAARDFKYFIQVTIPRLTGLLGPEKTVLCLQDCMQKIIDPNRHFAEWAQENPRNSTYRIDQSVSLLFMPLKTVIFQTFRTYKSTSLTKSAFCFTLTDSRDKPHFHLPFKTEYLSNISKLEIGDSSVTVGKVLESWAIRETPTFQPLDIESGTIQHVNNDEMKLIRILEFIPHVVNASDLMTNDFCELLIDNILSESRAISAFTIRVINQIFAENDDSRIIFYQCLVKKLLSTNNFVHIFILVQLFVKLLNLSLALSCKKEQVRELIHDCQSLVIFLFTIPYAEVRIFNFMLIERLQCICSFYSVNLKIDEILYKYNPIMSAVVRYKMYTSHGNDGKTIPSTFITFREAALSKYHNLYQYFLVELATIFVHLVKPKVLASTFKYLLSLCGTQPKDISSLEFVFFTNILTVMTNLSPTSSKSKTTTEYLKNRIVEYYGFPLILENLSEEVLSDFRVCKVSLLSMLQKIISAISSDQTAQFNSANIKLLKFINASMIGGFMPIFTKWCLDSSVQKLHSILPIATEICKNMMQTTDLDFSLMSYETGKTGILQFICIVEKHMNDLNLNTNKPAFILERGDLIIAHNYCTIVKNFAKALNIPTPPVNTGPVYANKKDEWIEKNWSDEKKKSTLLLLINWANLRNERDSQLASFGNIALLSLGSFIQCSRIFE
ncbi:hypothetical protein TRFO_35347 [Tritrichomonas foetus]|uniref:Uncharacterized protein n=1 Tax=Tritrichomonas foetus TaxID=1144522 RepID=A0A1J4JGJ6_9EUKA|nr:hypothetical protein TRFO_35347 [Tritrichomonas foetus]|eukprot:OHS98280.1 hypothetical protein TRFO_35347 [Tritrichomonas foetus]